ncbi:MAG: carboxypeptidase regulatory-like domain-containing protein, partial [Gemmatimonadota bacterium]|nr:carboxypeptidase regulatory-like domain-containing protein [Gemmatimonadota bacterium]
VELDGPALLSILITDAPSDYIAAAEVDIGRVELVPVDDGPHILLSEDGTDGFVNLLDFQNAATMQIAEAEVDPGSFAQLRMVVEAARVELAEGYEFRDGSTVMDLKVPSGAQSGIKLNLHNEDNSGPLEIVPGESVLVLDFDVNRSFVIQGNPETPAGIKGVIFKPTIRVTGRDVAASISGTVSTALEGVSVEGLMVVAEPTDGGTVEGYQTTSGTALTAEDGSYTVYFLVPGSYEVTVELPEGLGTDPEVQSVLLGESEAAAGVDFEVIEVTGSIAGTVTTELEGVSVEGLTVTATSDAEGAEPLTTPTESDGTYLFDGLLAGTYDVTVEVPEGLGTDPGVQSVLLGVGEDATGVDFEIIDITGSIAGTVSTALEGVSVEGLTVTATPGAEGMEPLTTLTEAGGVYLFDPVIAGSYVVTVEVGDDQVTDPAEALVEVGGGEDVIDVNFAIVEDLTGSIAGAVTSVLPGLSVEGLTVTATPDAEGAEPVTAVTLADGTYLIESVPAGDYVVTVEVATGFATDPADVAVTVGEDEAVVDVNFMVVLAGS